MNSILVPHLHNNATLLAPSRRLAASLRENVNAQIAHSEQVWVTPRIYALDDWLHALWDQFEIEGIVDKLLLNQTQVLLRFEEIIAQSDIGKTLLRQHQAAKTAVEAWNNLHHWLMPNIIYQPPENIDQNAFGQWAIAYKQWLQDNQFVDSTNLSQTLLPLMIDNNEKIIERVSPTKELILFGFEELSPLLSQFFNTLSMNQWLVHYQEASKKIPDSLMRAQFLQKEQECYAAANWAKSLLDEGRQNIAIVVPNLADMRSKLDVIFRDIFDPYHMLSPSLEVCPYFNISAATPLIQYPIIFEAMSLLKLGKPYLPLNDVLIVLTSVFTKGSTEEAIARVRITAVIKSQPAQKMTLNSIITLIKNHQDIEVPVLNNMLQSLSKLFAKFPKLQSYQQWSQCFREVLAVCGWPGERPLNSVEYQLVKRLDELFNELILCDNIIEEPNYFMALNTLQKLSSNVPFQPENKGAPIQILGLLEAAGQSYEHLWIMGMDSEAWPPHPTPNPFIPIELQRELKMPHAGAQREMQYAEMVTNRFKESASEIIFSYALKEKEKVLSVSELIQDIPLLSSSLNTDISRCETQLLGTSKIQLIQDDIAPSLTTDEAFKGTSRTLALQAKCPFKAFAELRLKLRNEEIPDIWLQAHEQGTILHDILEEFWQEVKAQEKLFTFTEEELTNNLQNLIEKHMQNKLSKEAPLPYIAVEKNRLFYILQNYIDLEKQREPFTVIAMEKKQSYELAGISFSIRLDRIDKTSQGELIILDYKTGNFNLSDIWGERSQEPQLPLYFLANIEQQPKAVAVIKLQSQTCGFEGISEHDLNIPGVSLLEQIRDYEVPKEWHHLQSYWQEKLKNLAYQFKEGNAQATPLLGSASCRYCHLSSLCRVGESDYDE
ncbi:MAG: PD-(D/E)XK nuclease family protein [Gammaproteobacteria bacterium]|jgi:probable DNA repair protein|nr:PD-(D/E)XK nuclease family protein [Gammaproteobacteria bacterium]